MKALAYILAGAIQPVIIAWLGGFNFEQGFGLGLLYITVMFGGLSGYMVYYFFEGC